MTQGRIIFLLACLIIFVITINGAIIKKKLNTAKRGKVEKEKLFSISNQAEEIWSSEYFLDSSIMTMGAISKNILALAENIEANNRDNNCIKLLDLVNS